MLHQCYISTVDRLPNSCVMHLVCWWAWGCLSAPTFSLHHGLAKLLTAPRKGEQNTSVFPCQYIAYPQQVLCSAFWWPLMFLGTVRPQHWTCTGQFVWPNGGAGGWGKEKSQRLQQQIRSYSKLSGCKCLHPDFFLSYLSCSLDDHWGTTVDFTTSFLHSCGMCSTMRHCPRHNTWRRQPQHSQTSHPPRNQVATRAFTRPTSGEESLGMVWPSLAWGRGGLNNLEEGKLQTETRLRHGPSPDLPTGRETGSKGMPLPLKVENSGSCCVCCPQNWLFMHLQHYSCATIFGMVWCCPSGSWPGGTVPGSQPGSQPQRSPTSSTDCDSDPSGLTMAE